MGTDRAAKLGVTLALAMASALAAGAENAFSRREDCNTEVCTLVASGQLSDLRWPDFTRYQEQITRFYEANSYQLAWVDDGVATARTREIAKAMRQAGDHALDIDDYDGRRWSTRILELDQHKLDAEALARFDVAFTVAVTRYVSDIRDGRANPGVYADKDRTPLAEAVQQLAEAADVPAALNALQPPFPAYRETLKALELYRTLPALDDGEKLPTTPKPVEPGQAYESTLRLARLLRLLGDLPEDATLDIDQTSYSGALVDAVKKFQSRHGLEADGRIGKGTFAALNMPLTERVEQLELALERWRWLPRTFTPSILVNIPEFRLRALDASHRTELEMKLVVGKAKLTPTPLVAEDMKYVIWRPYWNVPASIQRKELVPDVEKDATYLAKHGYEIVTSSGTVVSTGETTPETIAQLKKYSLRIRQTPGPKNSLGLVKFLFPNREDVYLHDTPSKSLFSRARRDFSHGCMRVSDPPALAAWVLRGDPSWTPERIATAMQGPDNVQVTLKQPIPVRVFYQTAMVLDTGEVRFFDDIYGSDAELARKLARD